MRINIATAAILFAGLRLSAADAPAAPEVPENLRAKVDTAIRKVYPALVRVHVAAVDYFGGRETKYESSGSGAVVSADGYVVTNHHVAGRAKIIRCTMPDREEIDAVLVGTDALADIAVLKLDLKGRKLPVAVWGDSSKLRVGDRVLAMGCPMALSQSVTLGIVSNVEMTFPKLYWPFTFKLDGEDTGSLVKWIGHDAQIFPGNSGGPLVNLDGEIIGVNEISLGLGGAIPGNLAREVTLELIKHGEVRRSWIGAAVQARLKDSPDTGALVGGVVPGSPAEKAGLKPGDLIIRYDGKSVDVQHAEQLPEFNRLTLTTPIGATVEIALKRDGKEQSVKLTTIARGTALGREAELREWGISVRELTLLTAKELKREPLTGVLVTGVRPGASAAESKPALAEGDIVTEVAGKPVNTVAQLIAVTTELTQGKTEPAAALVAFERKTEKLLTVVRLGIMESPDRSAETVKAWLPATVQALTAELAQALKLEGRTGVRVTRVFADAGDALKVGDIILKFDDEPVTAAQPEDVETFLAAVRQYKVGATVKLDLVRAGKPTTVNLKLGASPRSARELVEHRDAEFEFTARDLTFQDRESARIPAGEQGVLITSVESGGWAALAHLAVGDIVLKVDGKPMASLADLRARMKEIAAAKARRTVFFLRRGVHTLYLELEPAWPEK